MLNVVLRTCDRHSLQSSRIVNKKECIIRCLNSVLGNLKVIQEKHLHIIDDNSSEDLCKILQEMTKNLTFVTIDFLPQRDQSGMSSKKKSRHSLEVALDYIYQIPSEDLVYLLEDDYIHKEGAIKEMITTWEYIRSISQNKVDIGIFPETFNQLFYYPTFPFSDTYVRPLTVIPCPAGYYASTWFTHESFMINSTVFKENRHIFDSLLLIGSDEESWEGNTLSNLWQSTGFKMFMPLTPILAHLSEAQDIPYYMTKKELNILWEKNKTLWSSEQESQVAPLLDYWQKKDIE